MAQEEVKARVVAERRLKAAEESIHRLELALQLGDGEIGQGGLLSSSVQIQHLLPDVQNLKEYFEHVAVEAQLDANKPLIMKNAIVARKTYIERLRSSRLQKAKQDKDKSLAMIFDGDNNDYSSGLRRTKSMLLSNKTQKKLQSLRRTMSTRTNKPMALSLPSTPRKDPGLPVLDECDNQ